MQEMRKYARRRAMCERAAEMTATTIDVSVWPLSSRARCAYKHTVDRRPRAASQISSPITFATAGVAFTPVLVSTTTVVSSRLICPAATSSSYAAAACAHVGSV